MKVIVPFSPGGAVDATCRLIAEAFPQYMGDNKLIVENVAGGGAIIGQAQAVTSPADGYTMLATTTSFVTNTIMNDTPFEYTDVEPIAMYSFDAIALVVPADSQFQTLQEFAVHVRHSTDNVTHIDKDGNKKRYRELWETKSVNSVRDIPILNSTNEMLKQHRSQQRVFFMAHGYGTPEYVFTTETGEVISHSNFRRSYQRMLARAGVPYRKFHAVRHTFATEAIRSGVDVKDLQLLMGHSDISTTYIYVQSDNESRKNAIEKIGAIM